MNKKKIFSLLALSIFAVMAFTGVAQAATLGGYAWSSNIGWLGFGVGSGVTMPDSGTTRPLSGYAWSPNIGWVNFNPDLTGVPTGSGTIASGAKLSGNSLVGWARACSVLSDCTGHSLRTDNGGWDGWISMSGTGYGVTLPTSATKFSGYSWGHLNVGWMDWSQVTTAAVNFSVSCNSSVNSNKTITWTASPQNGTGPAASYNYQWIPDPANPKTLGTQTSANPYISRVLTAEDNGIYNMNVTVTDTASHLASVRCTPPVPFTIVPPGQPTVTLTLTPNGNQTINNVSGSGSLASSLVTVSITDGNGAAISGSYDFSYDLNTPNTSIGQAASQTITGRRNISCAGEVLPFFANSTDTSKSITKLSNGDKIRIKFPTLCYKPDGVSAYNLTGTYTVPIAIKNSDGTVAASSQINVSVNVPKINP